MANFSKALYTLECDNIRSMFDECSPTDGSRALSLRLVPISDPYTVRKHLSMTTDAKNMIAAKVGSAFFCEMTCKVYATPTDIMPA